MDNSMAYIDPNIDLVNLDVLYNVVMDKTFKRGKQGVPWRGGKEKTHVLRKNLLNVAAHKEEGC